MTSSASPIEHRWGKGIYQSVAASFPKGCTRWSFPVGMMALPELQRWSTTTLLLVFPSPHTPSPPQGPTQLR